MESEGEARPKGQPATASTIARVATLAVVFGALGYSGDWRITVDNVVRLAIEIFRIGVWIMLFVTPMSFFATKRSGSELANRVATGQPSRFKVRSLLVIVALIGVEGGLAIISHRHSTRAQQHDQILRSQMYGTISFVDPNCGHTKGSAAQLSCERCKGLIDRKIRYHQQLAQKYHDAAGSPWRYVEPDPPEPK